MYGICYFRPSDHRHNHHNQYYSEGFLRVAMHNRCELPSRHQVHDFSGWGEEVHENSTPRWVVLQPVVRHLRIRTPVQLWLLHLASDSIPDHDNDYHNG
jgi:hypothetical protein